MPNMWEMDSQNGCYGFVEMSGVWLAKPRLARVMEAWRRETMRRRYPHAAESDEQTDRLGWVVTVVVILALWALWEVWAWR